MGAGLFLHALHRERAVAPADDPVALRPVPALLRAQLAMGRDLLARSLAFQACFLSAAAVAARFGAATVAAHQVVLQLWFFMALVLDAVAIAAQSLVGAALGSGDVRRARALARQVGGYGLVLGSVSACCSRAGRGPAAAVHGDPACSRRSPPRGGSSPACSR